MKQVMILVGVSGAGKSTWAIDFIKKNPDYIRVNRDQARLMLVGDLKDYYTSGSKVKDIENLVTSIESVVLAGSFWGKGYNVIVDNTNLDPNRYKQYLDMPLTEVKFKFFDIDLETAKENVVYREDWYTPALTNPMKYHADRVTYIEKQIKQYVQAKAWILENHKDKIV